MNDKNKTLSFSGHRTEKLPKSKCKLEIIIKDLYNEIDHAIYDGYENFLFGACYGFDLICAEQVLLRKMLAVMLIRMMMRSSRFIAQNL